MKEEVAIYARRLHKQTEELLGTKDFHIAGGALRTYVEYFKKISLRLDHTSKCQVPIYSKDVDCFFGNADVYHLALHNLKDKGYEISDEDKIRLFDNAAQAPYGPYEEDEYEEKKLEAPTIKSSVSY